MLGWCFEILSELFIVSDSVNDHAYYSFNTISEEYGTPIRSMVTATEYHSTKNFVVATPTMLTKRSYSVVDSEVCLTFWTRVKNILETLDEKR